MDEFPAGEQPPAAARPRFFAKDRVWLNALLFLLTVLSTFIVGLDWAANYRFAEEIGRNPSFTPNPQIFRDPVVARLGLLYALVLMTILLGHELGHYLTCRRHGLSATLPFFIPAPTLVGTMGAFIRIRSPITRKRQLFDVGIAGPLMSFSLAVPALVVGLALSKVVPSFPKDGTLYFGEPLILKILGGVFFGRVAAGYDVILHPVAVAGWVGALVTAMNLFPLGQLDGGHVAYAFFGAKAKTIGRIFLVVLAVLGIFFWAGWIIWALLILLLGIKHPRIWDEDAGLGPLRTALGIAAFVMFVLSFIPDPVKGYNIFSLLKEFGR
jgi:hypothetical protein